jgi:hypothetical protein
LNRVVPVKYITVGALSILILVTAFLEDTFNGVLGRDSQPVHIRIRTDPNIRTKPSSIENVFFVQHFQRLGGARGRGLIGKY